MQHVTFKKQEKPKKVQTGAITPHFLWEKSTKSVGEPLRRLKIRSSQSEILNIRLLCHPHQGMRVLFFIGRLRPSNEVSEVCVGLWKAEKKEVICMCIEKRHHVYWYLYECVWAYILHACRLVEGYLDLCFGNSCIVYCRQISMCKRHKLHVCWYL